MPALWIFGSAWDFASDEVLCIAAPFIVLRCAGIALLHNAFRGLQQVILTPSSSHPHLILVVRHNAVQERGRRGNWCGLRYKDNGHRDWHGALTRNDLMHRQVAGSLSISFRLPRGVCEFFEV